MHPELRLLGQLLQELWRRSATIAGSLGVLLILWALDTWAGDWWENPKPWVYVAIAALGIIGALYLAWRSAWRSRGVPEEPYVSRGLRLRYQTAIQTKAGKPRLAAVIDSERPLGELAILLVCDGTFYPLSSTFCVMDDRDRRLFCQKAVKPQRTNAVLLDFRDSKWSEQDESLRQHRAVWVDLAAHDPIKLVRVETR
jgi:hypothetical protein